MRLFSKEDEAAIIAAIKEVEAETTGEIRVYAEDFCDLIDPVERAYEVFEFLGMEKTEDRNGVLIYLAEKTRLFAIFGDEQIYQKAGGHPFWKKEKDIFGAELKKGDYRNAVLHIIYDIGKALKEHFPLQPGQVRNNELPDEIEYGTATKKHPPFK